jgi:hypothetical protein
MMMMMMMMMMMTGTYVLIESHVLSAILKDATHHILTFA